MAAYQTVKESGMFEGSVIRATRRLSELLLQMEQAAEHGLENLELAKKLRETADTLRRGIMFAESLSNPAVDSDMEED